MIRSRVTAENAPPVMIRPPFAERAKASTARSITPMSFTPIGGNLHSERRRYSLNGAELGSSGSYGGISNDCRSRHRGRNLFEQFQPFPACAVLEQGKSSCIAAWTREACNVASPDRVADTHENDRHRACYALQRRQR